jgi:maleylpyruvate isomerase
MDETPEPSAEELRVLLDEIDASTDRLLGTVAELDIGQLESPSLLPGWSRRTVAAHLSYVAGAYQRMTRDGLAGVSATTYPGGVAERDRSLHGFDQLPPAEVFELLRGASASLRAMWRDLADDQWAVTLHEDRIGPLALGRLAALRLTELEVHHVDLGSGYTVDCWPSTFVEPCLRLRVAWLGAHHRRRPDADRDICGRWLLQTTDTDRRWLVEASPSTARASAAWTPVTADVMLSGLAGDLLAFLLGRVPLSRLAVAGDVNLARGFKRAFPGP